MQATRIPGSVEPNIAGGKLFPTQILLILSSRLRTITENDVQKFRNFPVDVMNVWGAFIILGSTFWPYIELRGWDSVAICLYVQTGIVYSPTTLWHFCESNKLSVFLTYDVYSAFSVIAKIVSNVWSCVEFFTQWKAECRQTPHGSIDTKTAAKILKLPSSRRFQAQKLYSVSRAPTEQPSLGGCWTTFGEMLVWKVEQALISKVCTSRVIHTQESDC